MMNSNHDDKSRVDDIKTKETTLTNNDSSSHRRRGKNGGTTYTPQQGNPRPAYGSSEARKGQQNTVNENRNLSNTSMNRRSNGNNTEPPKPPPNDRNKDNTKSSRINNEAYPPHLSLEECLSRYHNSNSSENKHHIVRGKLRVLPGNDKNGFVACDRGMLKHDVVIADCYHRNRALDGDMVYLELLPLEDEAELTTMTVDEYELSKAFEGQAQVEDDAGDEIFDNWQQSAPAAPPPPPVRRTWQDDEMQMDLWNPQVTVIRREHSRAIPVTQQLPLQQRKGRVVHVIHPKSILSELEPGAASGPSPRRRIVGSLMVLQSGTVLLTPNNKCLPQFKCPQKSTQGLIDTLQRQEGEVGGTESLVLNTTLFQAEYEYGSWKESHKNWAPCVNVQYLGKSCVMESEIQALLTDYQVDHGEFPSSVLKDVDEAVKSGVYLHPESKELGWKPTPEMYAGRRDYRTQRIFTIDPTTAKDLDDALHITELPDGSIEIGVHIADVSFFVRPGTAVDQEAVRRATTVYLVDRTIPMLPRPLCEVACSLNENVERLAFSCVWRMNPDGTLRMKKTANGKGEEEDVWYGRTVIKSCARLDYSTAQNIIEGKVGSMGEKDEDADEELWPPSRRPTGGHSLQQVAADVRQMHRVAMARRQLRFSSGALALVSVKLTFQLDADGQTPLLAAPYPIRDSNRLVEEYMLLANYLVAQRLITHAGNLACLRHHPPPKMESIDKVVAVAKAGMNFDIDTSSSQSLQKSLVRLGQVCRDPLVLNCVTQMLTLPMQQAQYFAAGTEEPEFWRHFALNIPYYTHFTSPIRRFPDVIVHRLLQATLDGKEAVGSFPQDSTQIQQLCLHCSGKQKASKEAQQRCDRVFLSLYLLKHPMKSQMGIVLSVGQKAFMVYIPSLGADALLYLDEHKDMLTYADDEHKDGTRRILLQQKPDAPGTKWKTLAIKVFTKLLVTIICKEKPPIDMKLRMEGPYIG